MPSDSLVRGILRRVASLLAKFAFCASAAAQVPGPFELGLAASSPCTPSWQPTFGEIPGTSGKVQALASFDDGSGPALFVGGAFGRAGSTLTCDIAKWDGSRWSALGAGMGDPSSISSLAVFDDGGGEALYVGGSFTNAGGVLTSGIAKWDGTTWSTLGNGLNGGVRAMAVFDDGSGAALYAGGTFLSSGGTSISYIAKWDGASWLPLGSGVDGVVSALQVFDDGGGEALFVGGGFDMAGGLPAERIAKWDGASWSALGTGVENTQTPYGSGVTTLTVFDEGQGAELIVGGVFTDAGSQPSSNVARWDGTSWHPLGTGLAGRVSHLLSFDSGNGRRLYASGSNPNRLARWDGVSWTSSPPYPSGDVEVLGVFDDGRGEALYAGDFFETVGDLIVNRVARWDGSNWEALGSGLDTSVEALTVFDDGSGPALHAGGRFSGGTGVPAKWIAKWEGTRWSALGTGQELSGSGFSAGVNALTVYDDGGGAVLIAGGDFTSVGGFFAGHLAQWDGSTWTTVGNGVNRANVSSAEVHSLAAFDDGSGPALFVGGEFTRAGGVPAANIASWNGSSWSPLATGTDSGVFALTVFDDGDGPALHAGGAFQTAGGAPTNSIAKWDGASWTALGSGMNLPGVHALTVYDDGGGPALVAGGDFSTAGGVPASRIAKWDGSSWSALGSGMDARVSALCVFDDGGGPALYAGGSFSTAGGVEVNGIARWDGSSWSALSPDQSARGVRALVSFDDGAGEALYAGGGFIRAFDSGDAYGDSYIARWSCPRTPFEDFCNGDGGNQLGCTDCPCSNDAPSGTVGGCLNNSSRSARLRVGGSPSAANDTLRLELSGGSPNTFAILYSGPTRAPSNPANPCFGLDSGIPSGLLDGLRCVTGSVLRHGTRPIDGAGNVGDSTNGWGPPSGPVGGLIAQGGFAAGETRHYQTVYRENVAFGCGTGLNTSQGVSVTFVP